MKIIFISFGILIFISGLIHSFLGERKILQNIKNNKTFSDTKEFKIINTVWHLTTILLFGFGSILIRMGFPNMRVFCVQRLIIMTFLASIIYCSIKWRGKYPIWAIIFFYLTIVSVGTVLKNIV